MNDVAHLMELAAGDEPPMGLDPGALVTAGRRARRRRQLGYAGSVGGVGVAGVALALALLPSAGGTGSSVSTGAAASRAVPAASTTPLPPASHGLTTQSLPGLVERDLGVRLSGVDVSVLPPAHDLDLSAGLASAQGQYLNVQVTPAGTEKVGPPTCADLEKGVDGDLYSGPCTVNARADGGYLVVRSGRSAEGDYAITQATLVTGDSAGITAESTNQLAMRTKPASGRAPVVSQDPPLTSAQLEHLVLTLQDQR